MTQNYSQILFINLNWFSLLTYKFWKAFFFKFSKHLTQNHTHTTFLLLLKKKWAWGNLRKKQKKIFKDLKKSQGNSRKFKVTQGIFFNLQSGSPAVLYWSRFGVFAIFFKNISLEFLKTSCLVQKSLIILFLILKSVLIRSFYN